MDVVTATPRTGTGKTVFPTLSLSERNELLYKGISLMCNLKINDAIHFFTENQFVDARFPCLCFLAEIWVAYAGGDEKRTANILKKMNKTIKDLEKISHFTQSVTDVFKKKPTPKDMEMDHACVLLALLNLVASSFEFTGGSPVKAGILLRRSWKFYEECYKMLQEYQGDVPLDPVYVTDVKFGSAWLQS